MKKIFTLLLLMVGIAASAQAPIDQTPEEMNETETIYEEEMFVDAQEEQTYSHDVEGAEDETSSVEAYDSASDFGD